MMINLYSANKELFEALEKAKKTTKYIRKYKGKNGKWTYIYRDENNKNNLSSKISNENDKTLKIYNGKEIFSQRFGKIQPTSKLSIQKAFEFESKIKNNIKNENGTAIDKNGVELLSKNGEYDAINFSDSELRIINGSEVFTHNHPLDKSFSFDDVQLAIVLGIKEIRVVSPEKTYSLKMSYKDQNKSIDEISNKLLYLKTKYEFCEKIIQKENISTIDSKEYKLTKHHKILEKLSTDIGFNKIFNIEYKVK